jgi:hypothetical protein
MLTNHKLHALFSGKSPLCPLDRRLDGPQSRTGRDDGRNICHCLEIKSDLQSKGMTLNFVAPPEMMTRANEIRSSLSLGCDRPQLHKVLCLNGFFL